MYTTKKKIQKDKDAEPTEFEETVAQALFDLENSNSDLKSELKDLFINSAVGRHIARFIFALLESWRKSSVGRMLFCLLPEGLCVHPRKALLLSAPVPAP
ncbi:hypothetical protein OIU84_028739 [Salix udensis]|uniref:40S ribosomal protein S7 n=1 Tax=Salix udensis TaxID=889485 RepID=A0AAD6P9N9_9ROSI|nr:hypothetical protein OIU84_028739 [Salix udensis]